MCLTQQRSIAALVITKLRQHNMDHGLSYGSKLQGAEKYRMTRALGEH